MGLRLDVSTIVQMFRINWIPEKTREHFATAHQLSIVIKTAKIRLERIFDTTLTEFLQYIANKCAIHLILNCI